MRHISARVAWHDGAWNGAVCSEASCSASRIVHDYIRKSRDDTGIPDPDRSTDILLAPDCAIVIWEKM